ncbi:MAG: 23S rRNA (uridine(2552)-2'-O)-methyltransferase RlmE [Pseudomonadales bacterium]|nr:23S rRNA (uridine(2552)-2'-O)-methyltransferase RlmE [Pseudomonadales bacterium]
MSKSKSSKSWLKEHFDDAYVRKSRADGYRSRASYKLLAIQEKDHILRPGMVVVDLGAAPGGWSQVAVPLVQPGGRIIASDILAMEPVSGVDFVLGDFTEDSCLQQILELVDGQSVDLVISDMAPNISGMAEIDQPRAMALIELALAFAQQTLKPEGTLLMKVFQGEGFEAVLKEMRQQFSQVLSRKPDASRSRSKEVYLLGKGFRA